MTTYVVSYDLMKNKDYTTLISELERLGGHRTLASVWLLNVNADTAEEVLTHLKGFIDSDDKLWVLELTKNRTFTNALKGTNDWLKNNPATR